MDQVTVTPSDAVRVPSAARSQTMPLGVACGGRAMASRLAPPPPDCHTVIDSAAAEEVDAPSCSAVVAASAAIRSSSWRKLGVPSSWAGGKTARITAPTATRATHASAQCHTVQALTPTCAPTAVPLPPEATGTPSAPSPDSHASRPPSVWSSSRRRRAASARSTRERRVDAGIPSRAASSRTVMPS